MEINVKEAISKLRSLLEKTQNGKEVVILKRGKKVARLVPIDDLVKQLPDLRTFRESISIKGKLLSRTVIQQRNKERY
jgi:prevent-host-death family protein